MTPRRGNFSYVLDVVQAMMLAATAAPGEGEVYNVASGTTYAITGLVTTLSSICGLAPEVVYSGQVRPGDAEKWVVDITRMKQLGYEPCTSLAMGLTAVWDWYKQQEALEKNTHDRQNQGCPSADG